MNIAELTNLYPVSKTLRFKLIPVGNTQDTLNRNSILEKDEERASDYAKIKKIIDRYHIDFIERSLCDVTLDDSGEYISICLNKERADDDNDRLFALEEAMRKQIASIFAKQPEFKKIFSKELILELLPKFVNSDEERLLIQKFDKFTTAFVGFHENRKNIYTSEAIPTAVAYRCVNDNLPKYISNIYCYEKIKDILDDQIRVIDEELLKLGYELSSEMFFDKDNYSYVLSQKGITIYNAVIGGWVKDDGTKVKGINEYINLYNQQLSKDEKSKRLPKLQFLYKQILSEVEGISFYQEGIQSDDEMLALLREVFEGENSIYSICDSVNELISKLDEFNTSGIFVSNGLPLTTVSKGAFGKWDEIGLAWEARYRGENSIGKLKPEKFEEKMLIAKKKAVSFSIAEINDMVHAYDEDLGTNSVQKYFFEEISGEFNKILQCRELFEKVIGNEDKNYLKTDEDIAQIKNMLDTIKNLEHILGLLDGAKTESDRDEEFYGEYYLLYDKIKKVDSVYNLVRNYVTKKPFSIDKYKLYFDQGDFLSGWDAGGNGGKRSSFLIKDGKYYLMIGASNTLPVISECKDDSADCYERVDYRLLTGANKMIPKVVFSNAHIGEFCPDEEILRIKRTESFKKGPNFSVDDCHRLIEFYQECIARYEWGTKFDFKFKNPEQYEDISKFYRDVETQGYKLVRQKVSVETIEELVSEGKVYLFQIYNKDFSEYSHGKPNLHTMYFKALFEDEYQKVIKLNGGAEMFMRRASISDDKAVVHPAGEPISSKNADNTKRSSCFEYDIVKDRRYTADHFEFHVPICINWTAANSVRVNERVRELLRAAEKPYVIGIDRGERNLLYICVIDGEGNIVEQISLNEIVNEYNGISYKTDYHKLLDYKENERKEARQNWTAIENIKELKEGYISQVIHKICQLVIKYNAVIALEDLNSGFKRGRTKVEKQVYQKFEKALIDKLNYLSDKSISMEQYGSIVHGYQMAEKFDSFSRMRTQNGIMFYIPAWLTSKIDPTTGFADLLHPKYENRESARTFIKSFDKIFYLKDEDMFVFDVDYRKFQRTEADYNKIWRLYTNGERIKTYRNPDKNNEWDYKTVNLTEDMKRLLTEYTISYGDGVDIRDSLAEVESSKFYYEFIEIVKLMLQMRNSISGRTDVDYLISPVKNSSGEFFVSGLNSVLPEDADANGAYNIARKVLWAINRFKEADIADLSRTKIAMTKKEWLEYAQTNVLNG